MKKIFIYLGDYTPFFQNYFEQSYLDLFWHTIKYILNNPEILDDLFQSFIVIFIFSWEIIKFFLNKDEDENNKEETNKDKGKGRATQEQEEEWYKESMRGSAYTGNNDNGDSDDEDKEKEKKIREENDKILAETLQAEYDRELNQERRENMVNFEDTQSLSSYSVISTPLSDKDDNERANRKIDLWELDKKLRLEKEKFDKFIKEQEQEQEQEQKKRKFDDDDNNEEGAESSSKYKHSKKK